jgi:SAM-dependent methyltransferase
MASGEAEDYYGELHGHSDPARAVGWEDATRQAARFEAVARYVREGDRVLDLGAGLGALGRFLATRVEVRYLGIERDPRLFERGRAMQPEVALRCADFMVEALPEAEVVAAVGVLVDGRSLRDDGVRFGRVRALLERVAGAARRVGVVVLLDQDRLEADPIRRLEPALGGVRIGEVPWLAAGGWEIEVVRVLETDLALVVHVAALRADEPAEVS